MRLQVYYTGNERIRRITVFYDEYVWQPKQPEGAEDIIPTEQRELNWHIDQIDVKHV